MPSTSFPALIAIIAIPIPPGLDIEKDTIIEIACLVTDGELKTVVEVRARMRRSCGGRVGARRAESVHAAGDKGQGQREGAPAERGGLALLVTHSLIHSTPSLVTSAPIPTPTPTPQRPNLVIHHPELVLSAIHSRAHMQHTHPFT